MIMCTPYLVSFRLFDLKILNKNMPEGQRERKRERERERERNSKVPTFYTGAIIMAIQQAVELYLGFITKKHFAICRAGVRIVMTFRNLILCCH